MLHKTIYIHAYHWQVECYFCITHYEQAPILRDLKRMQASEEIVHRTKDKMKEGDIALLLSDIVCRFTCDCCRENRS